MISKFHRAILKVLLTSGKDSTNPGSSSLLILFSVLYKIANCAWMSRNPCSFEPTGAKRGVITDVATKLQDVIDGINHVLHPDAPVTKRDLVDIAHQIEGVIGEISKILTPGKSFIFCP